MQIVTLSPQELKALVAEAAQQGAQAGIQKAAAFEQDVPAKEMRRRLKATDPERWVEILKQTGAKPSRRIDRTDMYLPSSFNGIGQ